MTKTGKKKNHALMTKYLSMILQYHLQEEDYGIAAITGFEVSPDGSAAWVTINTTSADKKMDLIDLLNENAGLLSSELADVLQIKQTPKLIFKADLSRESEEAVERILSQAQPVTEEEVSRVLIREKQKIHIPEKKTSAESNLKAANQKKPESVIIPAKTVKSSKSPSNKIPS